MFAAASGSESKGVVDPTQQKNLDQVFFGATVTYAHERGTERTITIVGVDEADLDRQQVSWISPIARALMNGENDYHRWCRRGRSRSSASELDIAYCASPDEGARGRHCRASDPCWDLSILKFSTSAIASPTEASSTECAGRNRGNRGVV
jgi:hypothetical protein